MFVFLARLVQIERPRSTAFSSGTPAVCISETRVIPDHVLAVRHELHETMQLTQMHFISVCIFLTVLYQVVLPLDTSGLQPAMVSQLIAAYLDLIALIWCYLLEY